MKIKTILILVLALFIFSSCAKIILSVGGDLVTVEDKIYTSLSDHKTKTEELGKKANEMFGVSSSDSKFAKINTLYSEVRTEHNNLVDKIKKKICKGKEIKYDEYKTEWGNVEKKYKNLNDYIDSISPGLAGDDITDLLVEAASKVLKALAEKGMVAAYAKAFQSEYSITEMPEL